MTTTATKLYTPQELLELPDASNCELVDGRLVERHTGSESSAIALAIGSILRDFVKKHRLGPVLTTDCGYQCFPADPSKIRRPDVSFVRKGRDPNDKPPKG